VTIKTPSIDVSGISRHKLLNVGLLRIEAISVADGEKQLSINMVVHINKKKGFEEELLKTVLNPLE